MSDHRTCSTTCFVDEQSPYIPRKIHSVDRQQEGNAHHRWAIVHRCSMKGLLVIPSDKNAFPHYTHLHNGHFITIKPFSRVTENDGTNILRYGNQFKQTFRLNCKNSQQPPQLKRIREKAARTTRNKGDSGDFSPGLVTHACITNPLAHHARL